MTSTAIPPETLPTTPEVSVIVSNPAPDLFNDDLGDLPESILESETVETVETAETPAPTKAPNPNTQVRIKTDNGAVWMLLPPDLKKEGSTISYAWSELIQQLHQRLNGEARSWKPNTSVRILTGDRLLDSTQFQDLNTVLAQANLRIKRIYTSRRQTAIAGATLGYSIEQTQTNPILNTRVGEDGIAIADPLYLQMTLRSGTEIRHDGSVIVMG
ncbi:MAG: septum site-determining protein MinC, partial [Alkalinema sp. FL-bin-369]|nr:septum site-determining protein MinC [Leptolyngbyaceae cyanobacterium LF-bin-369]